MPQISSYSFSEFTDLVDRSFIDWLKSIPQQMRNSWIVIEKPLEMHSGEWRRFAERLHRSQYTKTRDEWDTASAAEVQYWYEKDMQVKTESRSISITKRMRVAWKDQDILDEVTSLSEICPVSIDLDLAHRLTFAWSTSYTDRSWKTIANDVWDDLALIYTAHTLTWSSTTYSNEISWNPQFSKWALENWEKLFAEATYNNLGEKMVMIPDTIITTDDPNTINQVRELLNATADTDTSNSWTFNVYKSKYKHVISWRIATDANWAPDTTKRKYWFLADSRSSDFYLWMLEAPYLKTPTDWNNWEEFSSENWNYLAATTYWITIVTWRRIKGSKWDGS